MKLSKTLDRFALRSSPQSNSLAILHRSLSLEGFALAVLHRTRTRSVLHQIDPFCSSSNRFVDHQIADPKSKIDLAKIHSVLHQIHSVLLQIHYVLHPLAPGFSGTRFCIVAFVDSGAQSTIISKSLVKVRGLVLYVILESRSTNELNQGLAYVDFSDDVHLTAALAKNKQMFLNKKLSIAQSDPKQRRMRESVGRNTPMEHVE
ncbi:hypothetical protein LOK49_LG02G03564 [Camellia lanceoleosa]|uniref:Uncharacterized protein n=1 Tax=Camellia lanceoleosa TaxID=1840588 RepID=A0ACC0INH4_9ERIC|nr:hypothetical protein LOK49_LG02G03564 [Camellia lanceoleosa]